MSASPSGVEHLDVLVVGAGMSGVGVGRYLRTEHPLKTFAIFEARAASGGTWDLFRYPGIRSDSDLHTLGYEFKPWRDKESIASAPRILAYLRRTATENGLDGHIRYQHKVVAADWSSDEGRWHVDVERVDTGERLRLTAGWIFCAGGYFRYEEGYVPHFAGRERFLGQIVHPQAWPEDLDYAGKRVVVIGSGATAVTLVPAMAEQVEHITMLQRTPSYVVPVPRKDALARLVPAGARRGAGLCADAAQEHRAAADDLAVLPALPEGRAHAHPQGQRQAAARGLPGRRALQPAVQPVGPAAVRRSGRRPVQGDRHRESICGHRPHHDLHRDRDPARERPPSSRLTSSSPPPGSTCSFSAACSSASTADRSTRPRPWSTAG